MSEENYYNEDIECGLLKAAQELLFFEKRLED